VYRNFGLAQSGGAAGDQEHAVLDMHMHLDAKRAAIIIHAPADAAPAL
jgi:hypothetical protein